MEGKVWMYLRWDSQLLGTIFSASTDWWDEYFQDFNPLEIVRVEAREIVR